MNGRRRPVSVLAVVLAAVVTGSLAYAFSNVRKGYAPRQPILFRHTRMAGPPVWQTNDKGEQVNVGGFGIPCVYCHTMAYKGRHSTVPSTAVCMNCHSTVGLNKEWVLKMREYWDRGEPIPWVKVHDLPDFVYFNHSAHVNKGVGCSTCHGRVDEMAYVWQEQSLLMEWCLDCHRQPERHLRPKGEVYDITYAAPADQLELGRRLVKEYDVNPQVTCSTCHR
jgi:hypothetical protein